MTLLTILLACGTLAPSTHLPNAVSVATEGENGVVRSFLIELHRNAREQLDVRIAEGIRLYDGRHVWAIDGTTRRDLVANTSDTVPDTGAPVERDHTGPGSGFHVELDAAGRLSIRLPTQPSPGGGTVVAARVARILGVSWVQGQTAASRPVIDRVFRGRATLLARKQVVVVDGDLSEWSGADVTVVESSWQLEEGGITWQGARDASFSIAAAWQPGTVCFSGRVRDDDVREGDRIDIHIRDQTWSVPLAGAVEDGETCVTPELFGLRFETCRSVAQATSSSLGVFSRALLHDDDGVGFPTELATAAALTTGPAGFVRFMR